MILFDASDFYRTLLSMSIGALIMAACSVLKVHIIDHPAYYKVRKARIMLVLTYFVVVLFNSAELLLSSGNEILNVFFITSGMFESLFMIFFITILINPALLKWKWIYMHIAIITGLFACNLSTHLIPSVHSSTFFVITLIVYGLQLVFYTFFFLNVYQQTIKSLKDYYEEDEEIHIKWIRNSFIGLLIIGILTEISTICDYNFYSFFIISYTTVYSYIAIGFINRYYKYSKILPTVVKITNKGDIPEQEYSNRKESNLIVYNKNRLAMSMDKWISQKGYLKGNVPMEDVLKILDTTQPILRAFMQEIYGTDFRHWRNELRLEYAYTLLIQHPEYSVEMVAREVGFSDTNYFIHIFTQKYDFSPKSLLNKHTAQETK